MELLASYSKEDLGICPLALSARWLAEEIPLRPGSVSAARDAEFSTTSLEERSWPREMPVQPVAPHIAIAMVARLCGHPCFDASLDSPTGRPDRGHYGSGREMAKAAKAVRTAP